MKTASLDPASWTLRRVGIVGAGAMGTALAATLGSAVPVVMVCRSPERAAQLFRDGARLRCGDQVRTARPIIVRSIADLATIGGVSALFIATKTTAIPEIAAELAPLMGRIGDQPAAPFIVSYQNGIEPGRQLRDTLRDPRVVRMVINFGVGIDPDTGEARVRLDHPPHAVGSIEPLHAPVCRQIADMLTRAGHPTVVALDIEREVWAKAVMNAAVGPVAALVNTTIGQVMSSPARSIVERLLTEAIDVARAEGIDLGPDYRRHVEAAFTAGADHWPSMVDDIRAGRPSEVGQLNRQIIKHAQSRGVAVPTHEIIDALIETFDWKVYQATARARA